MKSSYVFFKQVATLMLFLISSTFIFSQQYLVNSEWTATMGNDTSQYFYKKATVKVDPDRNVYTLGSAIQPLVMIGY